MPSVKQAGNIPSDGRARSMMPALRLLCGILAAALSHTACASAPPAMGQQISTDVAGADLRSRIERTGSLRIIVTLAREGGEPASADAIRAKQDRLLAALEGTEYKVLHRYGSAAVLALVVSPKALDVLLASPLVASVVPDEPRRPTTSKP